MYTIPDNVVFSTPLLEAKVNGNTRLLQVSTLYKSVCPFANCKELVTPKHSCCQALFLFHSTLPSNDV